MLNHTVTLEDRLYKFLSRYRRKFDLDRPHIPYHSTLANLQGKLYIEYYQTKEVMEDKCIDLR